MQCVGMSCFAYWRLTLIVVLCAALGACVSSGPEIIGLSDSAFPTAESGSTTHKVFVATTRARSDNPAEFFSGERSGGMSLGKVDVAIPPAHQVGNIEKPSSGNPDPAKHFVVRTPEIHGDPATFASRLNAALAERPEGKRDILIFVHGYNVNFTSAVLRIAQFVHDTGYPGIPVLFTWASRGRTVDYVYDINSALQARDSLEELGVILSGIDADNVDIVAHSMGNLLVIETMLRLNERKDVHREAKLRRVVLASPDIDIDLFETQLTRVLDIKDQFVVLVSEDDRALSISRRIAGGVTRVGATDAETLSELGVNVIDLTQVEDSSSSHHTKFANSPDVVQLIGRGIQDGNTLSASENPGALRLLSGDLWRGIAFVPSASADATPNGPPPGLER